MVILYKIQEFIESNKLLELNDKPVIVGLSGGSDSVVLLDILKNLGYNCIAAHCNFHLRSDESNRDELFVRNLAEHKQIKLLTIDFQTIEYAEANNISIEMAARDLRYDWFEKLRIEFDAQAIATGHHLDDNFETVLLNFTRGTGIKGMTGIPVRNGNVVRPLLNTSRADIKQHIEENNLQFVEDSTNNSTDIVRNKFRHIIIPALEEINPSFKNTCSQTIQNLKGAYNIFNNEIKRIQDKVCTYQQNTLIISIKHLLEEQEINTVLYEILKDYDFNSTHIRQIVDSLNSESGKIFSSKTHTLLKDRKNLIIKAISNNSDLEFNNIKLKSEFFKKDGSFVLSRDNNIIHLDAKKINYPLTIRRWEAADYFYPLGMKGKKKISDFLIDLKINRFNKENTLIVLSENKIVWVVGYRIDDRFKVTENTTDIMELKIELKIES